MGTVGHWLGEVRELQSLRRGPTGMLGFGAVGSGLCGALVEPTAWAGAAGCVAGLGVGWTWPRVALAGVVATLRFDRDRCHESERLGAKLRVVNRSLLPAAGIEVTGLPGVTLATVNAPPRGTFETRLVLKPAARGRIWRSDDAATLPRLTSSYPLGVSGAVRAIKVEGDVLIWPGVVAVEVPDVEGDDSPSDREARAGRRAGTGGETTGVRQYRRGDAARDVHWRQTARAGELMVRERQATSIPQATVVLDVDERSYANPESFEHAVRVTAAAVETLSRRGSRVTLNLGAMAAASSSAERDGRFVRLDRKRTALDSLALVAMGRVPLQESLRATRGERAERLVVTTRIGRDSLGAAEKGDSRFLLVDSASGRGS